MVPPPATVHIVKVKDPRTQIETGEDDSKDDSKSGSGSESSGSESESGSQESEDFDTGMQDLKGAKHL